jgi:hypothetical protein
MIFKMLFYRSVKPVVENVPISVRKMSDHEFPSLSINDKNKMNGLVLIFI